MMTRLRNLGWPDSWRDQYQKLRYTKHAVRYGVSTLAALVLVVGAAFFTAGAWQGDVLYNGNFEHGFHVEPCGVVGNNWHCFTNGGAANYGFYDDQWEPVVADGYHSQLIEINTKGIGLPDPDRYAGIYQTVKVTDWAEYTLNLRGMIRTTNHGGDPWRYRVEVGWTHGAWADWTKVDNWRDVGWDTYYDRVEPGTMSAYSTHLTAKDDYVTLYIRFWKKWGVPEQEILLNVDSISLVGAAHGYYEPKPAPPAPKEPYYPPPPKQPHPQPGAVSCDGPDYVYNGGFEHGFNDVGFGHVGKGWGAFTNGGAAAYGFYDDQWVPVVAEGAHSQLIEINTKGIYPADHDRYAGIYQRITGLTPGTTYQLSVRGLLRGTGTNDDPARFVAEWGYNGGHDTDWTHVTNWVGMNLGVIYPRTEPGSMGTYTAKFVAESHSIVLFLRGWKKWGITDIEMDLNLDAIQLTSCSKRGGHHYPVAPKPTYPEEPKPIYPVAPKPAYPDSPGYGHDKVGGPKHVSSCTYIVQPGDMLSVIAERYRVPLYDLAAANGIHNPNLVFVGQKLYIPGCSDGAHAPHYKDPAPAPHHKGGASAPHHKSPPKVKVVAPVTYRTHTVRPGDTLSAICLYYGVEANELIRMNNITNPNWIYVGQVLHLP